MPPVEPPVGPQGERRATPRRRLRDRVASRDGTANPVLNGRHELQNLLLLIDDDLRETALSMGGIDKFIGQAIELLESEEVDGAALHALARDQAIDEKMDTLVESLLSLRRRIGQVASTLAE